MYQALVNFYGKKNLDALDAEIGFEDDAIWRKFSNVLVNGAMVIKKATIIQLRKDVRIRGYSPNSIKYGRMDRGVKVTRNHGNKSVNISLFGDFRLKFFEMGTDIRVTRRGYNRGQITHTDFFKKTRENSDVLARANEAMVTQFYKNIAKYLK